jgi:hypothetical protein
VLQAKLTVGGDGEYEREADQVAARVLRVPETDADGAGTDDSRQGTDGAAKGGTGRPGALVRRRVSRSTGSDHVDGDVKRAIRTIQGRGRPLSARTRSFFESRFGRDMGNVRVHTGRTADQLARSLGATAFTIGTDIVFRSSAYRPGTRTGKRLLAHELTHVVQQAGGRGTPDVQRQTDGSNRVVTLCDRNFATAGDTIPAKHCFVWYRDEEISPTPENIRQEQTSTFDPNTAGGPDPAANDDSVVCRATYDVDPECVRDEYENCEGEYNMATFNCCSCAHQAIEACGGSTTPGDFPPANHGIGLPEEYGSGWKRPILESGDWVYQTAADTVESTYQTGVQAVEGIEATVEAVGDGVAYMNSRQFLYDLQRHLAR